MGWLRTISPLATRLRFFPHFARKERPVGRFCRLCRLVSTVPSMLCDLNCSMASKRSSVRPRSGSQIARSKYQCDTLADRSTNRTGGRIRLVQLSVNSEKMTPRTTNVQSIWHSGYFGLFCRTRMNNLRVFSGMDSSSPTASTIISVLLSIVYDHSESGVFAVCYSSYGELCSLFFIATCTPSRGPAIRRRRRSL